MRLPQRQVQLAFALATLFSASEGVVIIMKLLSSTGAAIGGLVLAASAGVGLLGLGQAVFNASEASLQITNPQLLAFGQADDCWVETHYFPKNYGGCSVKGKDDMGRYVHICC